MVLPFGTITKYTTPSKFPQGYNNPAFCENRSHFATTASAYAYYWNTSTFHRNSQVGSEWSGRHADFPTVFDMFFTVLKLHFLSIHVEFLSSSCLLYHEYEEFGQPMFAEYRVYPIICVCWWMDSSFRLLWVWHQNPPLLMGGVQEFHCVRG